LLNTFSLSTPRTTPIAPSYHNGKKLRSANGDVVNDSVDRNISK